MYSVCTRMYECVCTCIYVNSIELSGDNVLQLIKEVNKAVQNDEDGHISYYMMCDVNSDPEVPVV